MNLNFKLRQLSYTFGRLRYCKILAINFKERLNFLGPGAWRRGIDVGDDENGGNEDLGRMEDVGRPLEGTGQRASEGSVE